MEPRIRAEGNGFQQFKMMRERGKRGAWELFLDDALYPR